MSTGKFAIVPVKISGNTVGTAKINEDGSIEIKLPESQFGRELLFMTERGLTEGLQLSSDMKSARKST